MAYIFPPAVPPSVAVKSSDEQREHRHPAKWFFQINCSKEDLSANSRL